MCILVQELHEVQSGFVFPKQVDFALSEDAECAQHFGEFLFAGLIEDPAEFLMCWEGFSQERHRLQFSSQFSWS